MSTATLPQSSVLIGPAERAALIRLRAAHPAAGVRRLAMQLEAETGVRVSYVTVGRELRRLGLARPATKSRRRQKAPTLAPATVPAEPKAKKAYAAPPPLMPAAPPYRRSYQTDLTDRQWTRLEALIPAPQPGGRPATIPRRELVNAMFYVLRTGCQWRALPHDFPPWQTVYWYFRKWRDCGLWQQINDALRPQVRQQAGRNPTPSAACLDSQSVKTTEKGGTVVTTAPSA